MEYKLNFRLDNLDIYIMTCFLTTLRNELTLYRPLKPILSIKLRHRSQYCHRNGQGTLLEPYPGTHQNKISLRVINSNHGEP